MLSFKQYIVEGSVRTGLPHITTMSTDQFKNLTKNGQVHLHDITEKSDGMPHEFGHDEHGFYTRTKPTGDAKVRSTQEYQDILKAKAERTGNPYNPDKTKSFAHIHSTLQNNKALTDHLKNQFEKTGQDVRVKGEILYKPISQPSEHKGERRFVLTSYDANKMGSVGKYIIHSKLPENAGHDIDHFKNKLSNSELNFDGDKVEHKPSSVDISKESHGFGDLNHDLINSRTTKTNKEAKLAEIAKFDRIKKKVSDKVDKHVDSKGIKNLWGSESEGLVVHPSKANPEAPRFKVTSSSFRQAKAARKGAQIQFKRDENA